MFYKPFFAKIKEKLTFDKNFFAIYDFSRFFHKQIGLKRCLASKKMLSCTFIFDNRKKLAIYVKANQKSALYHEKF